MTAGPGPGRPGIDPAWFAAVMGTAGTAAALGTAAPGPDPMAALARVTAWTLLIAAAVGFVACTVLLTRTPRRTWTGLGSPDEGPVYATIPGAMLVLLTAAAALTSRGAVPDDWWWPALAWTVCGAALSLVVTVRVFVSAFVHDSFPVEHLSGAWFVPETALMLAGMVLGRLALTGPGGWAESLVVAAFALVGAGAVLFGLTAAVFFTRLILYPHVRASGAPGMWIMLSPLSIAGLALHQVGADAALLDQRLGSGLVAVTDLLALLLWGFSLWWIAAAGAITWRARTAAFTHRTADWSFVFPTAALALATSALGRVWGATALNTLGTVSSVTVLAVWALVAGDTVRRAAARPPRR